MSIPHMLTIPNLSLQTCSILYGVGISAPWLINAYTTCLDRLGAAESSWTPQMNDLCWGIDILNLHVTFSM